MQEKMQTENQLNEQENSSTNDGISEDTNIINNVLQKDIEQESSIVLEEFQEKAENVELDYSQDDEHSENSDICHNIEKGTEYKLVKRPNWFTRFIKRTFDICSSLFAIILLLPFFLIFTPIVAIAMKGNPFFVQERAGKNEKIFSMIKYRTMTNAKDKEGNLLSDSDRLTKFGKIMRALSLDELPELFNILIGNMSVVGPRPLLVKYLERYNDFQRQRHLVRPGLTGLAQVSGRNAISWEEKFEKDIEYIEKMSFWFDLKVIFMTIKKVLVRDGISQEGEATMEYFTGNKD